jgi:DNA helicase-2/ATP-dependent DNA helicase PcrA
MFIPRPKQEQILAYRGGKMGVSAVPGSGKTQILSMLAAQIIADGLLEDEQEVLVVTLVNAAVDNFSVRVGNLVKEKGLLPNLGYRVRTLHGLAHDIVRERPDLLGLSENFQIIDEREVDKIRREAASAWLKAHPYALDDYLDSTLEQSKLDWVRRDHLPARVSDVALAFIRLAKDKQLSSEEIRARLEQLPVPLPLAQMGCEIYQSYQQALVYRGALDFDDLIRLAIQAIRLDESYLERLRYRWPYILEDEAQDSSQLQEQILEKLAEPNGNWVRVGDPNQAIFETFTTASPESLRQFLDSPEVDDLDMPNSGRSTSSIIDLANYLIEWTQEEHPREEVRQALVPPPIEVTPPGDPQPNPPDDPQAIHLVEQKMTPQGEMEYVVESIADWLPSHPDNTVAVLVPRNQRGFDLAKALGARGLEYSDSLLRSTAETRGAAGALANILNYLAEPGSSRMLSIAYNVWRREAWEVEENKALLEVVKRMINKCRQVEDYLWPRAGNDWFASLNIQEDQDWVSGELQEFRQVVRRWQGATTLPIDQLVLSLAQDLFHEPPDLAIAHKLALLLRQAGETNSDWHLPDFTEELAVIAKNERRFLGFSDGLQDRYIAEAWFLRDHLNLEAETIKQLEVALSSGDYDWYEEGQASKKARLDYVAERLRLLYVGITRAKKELFITRNTGRDGKLQPAESFQALIGFWEDRLSDLGGGSA